MPWTSKKQQAWGNSPSGVKAMGATKVHEFNQATKHPELLKRFAPPKKDKGLPP